jgi:hypothetical protein
MPSEREVEAAEETSPALVNALSMHKCTAVPVEGGVLLTIYGKGYSFNVLIADKKAKELLREVSASLDNCAALSAAEAVRGEEGRRATSNTQRYCRGVRISWLRPHG